MRFQHKLFWSIGIGSILLLLGAFLFPGSKPNLSDLPWHLNHTSEGNLNVLGITLGKSTVVDAEARFRESSEVAIFVPNSGPISAEAFFEQINLAGLRSKVVLTLAVSNAESAAIAARGSRSSAIPSGKRITPSPDDMARLRTTTISSLTLIPGVRVSEELLVKRFGVPDLRIKEKDSEIVHHLYKKHALDIASSPSRSEKQVFQYVSPRDFAQLETPLLNSGGTVIRP